MNQPTSIANAIHQTLKQYAPDAFVLIEPFIAPLLMAEDAGDTFIFLSQSDAKLLKHAAPIVSDGSFDSPMVLWKNKLFWTRLFAFEQNIATSIKERAILTQQPFNFQAAYTRLNQLFGDGDQNKQKQAAALALLKHFILISGGPGTGKTTTVAKLMILFHEIFEQVPNIALAAPTGKAAARLTQSLHNSITHLELSDDEQNYLKSLQGQTLHRLLGLNPINQQARFNPQNPLPVDVLILDEASMLDLPLMLQTLKALKSDARLILLGDKDQLPSIGAGALIQELFTETELSQSTSESLSKLLPSHNIPLSQNTNIMSECVVELTVSHRFDQNSGIGNLAQAVNNKQQNLIQIFNDFPEDIQYVEHLHTLSDDFFKAQAPYWQAVAQSEPKQVFAAYNHTIVLTVLKEDAQKFNQIYLKYLERKGLKTKVQNYFAGQSLMITQNDYLQGLFNGDIGIVLPNKDGELTVFFESADGVKNVALSRLPPHEIAFAYTVHKSQGSEFDSVWLLSPSINTPLFNQALLYTAITRAKSQFKFWGSIHSLQQAVNIQGNRKSALRELLNHTAQLI